MPAVEFDLWREFYTRFGFDADRLEYATAASGAYVGAAHGGKARPADLVLSVEPGRRGSKGLLRAYLPTVPGSQVTTYPRVAHGR